MSEVDESLHIDGGYQESSKFVNFSRWFVRDQSLDSDEGKIAVGEYSEKLLQNVERKEAH